MLTLLCRVEFYLGTKAIPAITSMELPLNFDVRNCINTIKIPFRVLNFIYTFASNQYLKQSK